LNWKEAIRSGPFSETQSAAFIAALESMSNEQLQWLRGYFAGESITQKIGRNDIDSPDNGKATPLTILYGTQTGNSQKLADFLAKKCKERNIATVVQNMSVFKAKDFKKVKNLAVIVSTQGIGEPPIEAAELHDILQKGKVSSLEQVNYAVLSLGDTSYSQFCQTGKDFDSFLEKLKATRILQRKDCDVDYEDDALSWIEALLGKILQNQSSGLRVMESKSVGSIQPTAYSRKNPFEATLMNKIKLNGRGSTKETIHAELSLTGSGIEYKPGDSLGIYAENSPVLIDTVLNIAKLSGTERVKSHAGDKSLVDALRTDYELTPLTALTLNRYAELTDSQALKRILSDPSATDRYLYGRDVADLLKEYPFIVDAVSLISILRKSTPRLYSIASSREVYEDEVHMLVSTVRYQSHSRVREGFCSTYLADRIKEANTLKIFVEDNVRFRLPKDNGTPIIMIGPGTGVAPFRAFMQHREAAAATGKSWLFFGERNFTTDFLYQTEWHEFLKKGILTKCDVAFSRDTDKKYYVQNCLSQRGKEIFRWLQDGAHIYICGDAKGMAKDVDRTLHEIIRYHGEMDIEKADEYLKYLRLENRYQTDVY
jgi:sulfite reductase (NADPH) flavoprotein alpha-component